MRTCVFRPNSKDGQVSVDSDCLVVTSTVGSWRYSTLPDDLRRFLITVVPVRIRKTPTIRVACRVFREPFRSELNDLWSSMLFGGPPE